MITTRGFAARSGVGVSGDSMFIGGTGNQAPYTTKITTTEHFQTINTTTASFYAIDAKSYSPRISRSIDVSGLTYSFSSPAKSLSDMSAGISGSFNHGFMFKNSISGSATTTGSLSNFKADKIVTSDMSIGSFTDTNQLPHQSSSFRSHTNKPHIIPYVADKFYDTRQYVPTGSGHKYSCGSCTAFSNGFDTSDGQLSIGRDGILNISFITASGVDSGLGKTPGAFSSLPNMITATRANTFGSTNAAVVVSGNTTNAENATTSHVQHFNGVSWRRGPDILVDRASPGGGQGWGQSEDDVSMNRSQTNATKREHMQYNGHTWWYMTCNNTTEQHGGAAGSQNSAIIFGGEAPAVATEEWNGHSWSAGGEMNVAKTGRSGAGTQNAAIAGSGQFAPTAAPTELYDGTTWTAAAAVVGMNGGDLQTAIGGFQDDAIAKDGTKAFTWDGVAWAKTIDTDVNRFKSDVAGTSARSIIPGGGPSSGASIATVIEWNNSFNTGSYLLTKKIGSNHS